MEGCCTLDLLHAAAPSADLDARTSIKVLRLC